MDLGGSFTLPGTSMTLNRMGYGAMQLAGLQVWRPPRDVDSAIAVLRVAVAVGVMRVARACYPDFPLRPFSRSTRNRCADAP